MARTKKPPSPTRAPKRPPFAVGTELEYIGTSHITIGDPGREIAILSPHLVVEIDEVKLGRKGTGQQLRDHDGPMFYEDTGEPILDETQDGWSVYHVIDRDGRAHGRIIRHENAGDWKVRVAANTFEDLCYAGTRVEVSGMDGGKRKVGEAPRFYPGKVVRWTASWLHVQFDESGNQYAFTRADIKRHVRRAR